PVKDRNGDPLPKGAICRLGTARLKHAGPGYCVCYSPNGRILASGGDDKLVRLWNAETGKELQVCAGHTEAVLRLAFSPDSATLASTGADQSIRIWEVASGKELARVENGKCAGPVVFCDNGKSVAYSRGDKIQVWDFDKDKELRQWYAHAGGTNALALSPD